ncbi:hypothetical protein [Xenorhabdus sp. Sc-CR9]|uniref:hypothetical protein n=1 Tax=Xenorhabdus sp. Sc-CR9 TaxID=2584468 RepID=UPI001F479D04|nr:hypothetical protein [Xenorhabdus sp. Sc-CR9]
MTKHIHADLMMKAAEIAQENENWWEYFELKYPDGSWRSISDNFGFHKKCTYRLKPRTIRIGNIDVPEPVREPLEDGQEFFVPDLGLDALPYHWSGTTYNLRWLESGIIHLDRESAELHAKALIALTAKNDSK